MESLERIENLLERIAISLETIASINIGRVIPPVVPEPIEIIDEEEEENGINEILTFLSRKNIQVKTYPSEVDENDVLNKLATFIGTRYASVSKTYKAIKSSLTDGRNFSVDLRKDTQTSVTNSTQLCTELHKIAFLSDYKYLKSPQYRIMARANRSPLAINFFTGGWFELYVRSEALKVVRKIAIGSKIEFLSNPQIILPNGNDFELDLLLSVDGEIFWFESKTGTYQDYVDKYSRMAKLMNLDKEHAFMILTEVNATTCSALSSMFGMNVVNAECFPAKFEAIIAKTYGLAMARDYSQVNV
jgi:hypothetical protein